MKISDSAEEATNDIKLALGPFTHPAAYNIKCIIQTAIDKELAKVHKELGCELQDPNGTIWDEAKRLQKELAALKETHSKCAY